MANNGIQITRPGTYFFKSGNIKVQLNKECLLLFQITSQKTFGLVYFDPMSQPVRSLHDMLDSMYGTLKKEDVLGRVECKLFGMSVVDPRTLAFLYQWTRAKKLNIQTEDLGRNTVRNLVIECEAARIGVQYAEGTEARPVEFFSTGSAKSRLGKTKVQLKMLILSDSLVEKRLTAQSAEEHVSISVDTPKNVKAQIKKKPSSWDLVLVSDELVEQKTLQKWFEGVIKFQPGMRLAVLGSGASKGVLKKFKMAELIKPQPEKIIEFKNQLGSLFESIENNKSFSTVVSFKSKKSPKRSSRSSH